MVFIIILIFGILIFPQNAILSGKMAVDLCFYQVIPALFPFFVLQDLLVKQGFSNFLSKYMSKPLKKVFKTSNLAPFLLGIIGGYPIGAKTISTLYKDNKICKKEAVHLLSFCNNAGPAFIIGFVGTYIFKSAIIGYILAIIHILSAILVGILVSFGKNEFPCNIETAKTQKKLFYEMLIDSINTGFSSVLGVCGFIIFFNVFVEILTCFNIFRTISYILTPILTFFAISSNDLTSLLVGIFEMTNGLNYLVTSTSNLNILVAIASFTLAFGGFSVHFQTLNFCKGLNFRKYFFFKLLQGVFATVLSLIVMHFFKLSENVANFGIKPSENLFFRYNSYILIAIFSLCTFLFVAKNLAKLTKKVYNSTKTFK